MVLQDSDSKISGLGGGNSETGVPSRDEESTAVATKQTALRDSSQTSNAVTEHDSVQKSPAKDIRPVTELSGTKRAAPESQESLSQHRSPSSNTNGQLVYVRRKSEADSSKSSASDNSSEQISQPSQLKPKQPVSQIAEPKASCLPAFAPFPMTSSVIPPGKSSVPLPVGVSAMRSASAEPESRSVAACSTSAARNLEVLRNLHWEARYNRLQTLLKKLDQRQQEGYVSLLRQLTARELSGHAVELEKRSMQLSIEEAKELQRVEALNMLSKPSKSAASQALARPGRQGKP